MVKGQNFTNIAFDLEDAGLLWRPSVGDEVCSREEPVKVSILVDSAGMTPKELRSFYLWLPTVEQLVFQLEVRHAVLKHAGLELKPDQMVYKSIVETNFGVIESQGKSLRGSIAVSLRDLLKFSASTIH